MLKLNNKGFSLAELLGVMVIIIILFSLGIAGVTTIINSSSKNLYVTSVKGYIDTCEYEISQENYDFEDEDSVFFIDTKYFLEGDTKFESPFGDFVYSFLVLTFDGNKYHFYYTGIDDDNMGIELGKEVNKLSKNDVKRLKSDDFKMYNFSSYRKDSLNFDQVNLTSNDVYGTGSNNTFFDLLTDGTDKRIDDLLSSNSAFNDKDMVYFYTIDNSGNYYNYIYDRSEV